MGLFSTHINTKTEPYENQLEIFQIDKQLASGEYFLSKEQRKVKQQKEKEQKHVEAAKRREERRQQAFIPPEEPSTSKTTSSSNNNQIDLDAIRKMVKKAHKGGATLFNKKV